MVRFVGLTSHRRDTATAAVASGLYDTIQFPLCTFSSDRDLALIAECQAHDIGLIAMKALSGGLLTDAVLAFAFLRRFDNLVPIWGIQHESELNQFLALERPPPPMDEAMWRSIERDRARNWAAPFAGVAAIACPAPQGFPYPWRPGCHYC